MPKVTNTSTDVSVECAEGADLREVAEEQGLDIPFGCGSGTCGTCLIHIGSGAENLSEITETEEFTLEAFGVELDGNTRLSCQCKVKGDVEFSQ